ncbi:MAG TPA: hypothetical protein VKB71_00945 [Rhizomicrobium sp.]|nr:hypothetical protein [Rhizomicrobium sp.]
MKIWEITAQEGSLIGYLPDKLLSKALILCGSPAAERKALHTARASVVQMQLAKPTADTVEKNRQSIPDFLIGWMFAIFSERAASAAIRYGCESEEFWPCRFQSNPDEEFFLHLPVKAFDIVDVDKTTFKSILPLDPPLPLFIENLVTKPLPAHLPPCFRAERPGTDHVFSELFIRDDFKLAWQRNAFSGADFRLLST